MKVGRRTGSRSRIAVMGLGLLAAGAMAVPALASQTEEIDSKVTLAVDSADCSNNRCFATAFHGRVTSSKHACEVRRKVKVFGAHSGNLIGEDRSNRRGKWRFIEPGGPGNYQAKVVRREKEGTGGRTFVCSGDRSRVIGHH